MDTLRTQLYTLDHLLKELSVQIARNDTHNEIRTLAREGAIMAGHYHGQLTPSRTDRLRNFVYDHLRNHISEEYLFYGRTEAENRKMARFERYCLAGSR